MAIHCNGINLPFELTFVYQYGQEVSIGQLWKPDASINHENLIEINEDWPTAIRFRSDSNDYWDEDAHVIIQTSLFDHHDDQRQLKYVMNNEIQWIYKERNGDVQIYPWRMGSYLIDVIYKNERYVTGFIVKPNHLSKNQILNVHNYLEEKIEGIIYDIIHSNQTFSKVLIDDKLNKWYYDYARYMKEMKDKIMYASYLLIRNPSSTLQSEYKTSVKCGKSDYKANKLNLTKSNNKEYQKIKIESYNTKDNQWIKNILLTWNKEIQVVIEKISIHYHLLRKESSDNEQEITRLEQKKSELQLKRDVAINHMSDLKSRIKTLKKQQEEKENFIQQHKKWLENLSSIQSQISFILNETLFKDVDRGYRRPILKKNVYHLLNDFFEETKTIKKDNGNKKNYIKVLKPTWQIYEYYCLFETIDCLLTEGYALVKGFNANGLENYYENKIPEGTQFVLAKDSSVIHVWYDKYHAHSVIDAKEKGELFFINDPKKRPDIKLDSYFKDENGDLWFKDCLVMDAKFRKLSNITNKSYISETFDQLLTYNNIYFTGDNRLNKRHYGTSVNRVVCLYASDGREDILTIQFPITFIKLFPQVNMDNTTSVIGNQELKQVLLNWLSE
jgi:hypothetical protein